MRPQAEVDELPHRVALHASPAFSRISSHLSVWPLLRRRDASASCLGDELPLDRPVLLDDVRHPLLDGDEVLGRERLCDQEVVEEAVLGRRTDPALRVREELGHRRGQQVGGRVPVDLERGISRLGLAGRTGLVGGLDRTRRRHLEVRHRQVTMPSSGSARSEPSRLVGAGGIEPPTSSVSRKRSTTEPRAYGGRKDES